LIGETTKKSEKKKKLKKCGSRRRCFVETGYAYDNFVLSANPIKTKDKNSKG